MVGFGYNVHNFLAGNPELLDKPMDELFQKVGCGMVKIKKDFEFCGVHIRKGFYLGFEGGYCVFIIANIYIKPFPSIEECDGFREKATVATDIYVPEEDGILAYSNTDLFQLIHRHKSMFIDQNAIDYCEYWRNEFKKSYGYLLPDEDEYDDDEYDSDISKGDDDVLVVTEDK
ncbi:MAG: hypothetical protein KHZ77_04765 [Veillonella sp.]|uniref:hypothetical protein n=1 Tax=Veillonella sp. TaxID=1926307 RepID=UPI0025DAECBB|nr:hypothetical protein [Veillonella sp.]MBS4913462.1 hypothetical protein [Veillonella sp.]